MTRSIGVIGGGISGLAAAHRLLAHDPTLDVTVFEREKRLGGKILTERRDGYVIEGGPDSFLSVKPRGVGLSRELGLEGRLIEPDERNRGAFVLHRGALVPIPEGLSGLVPSRLSPIVKTPLLTRRGKLRLAAELLVRPRRSDDDESLASFVERRLGREAYERLIEPLMSGIYAGDGRRLSLAATFPNLRLAELNHGGLIRGAVAARTAAVRNSDGTLPRRGFLSYPTGMAELAAALRARIEAAGGTIHTGTTVSAIRPRSDGRAGYDLEIDGLAPALPRAFDAIIVATPAWAASPLLRPWSTAAADALAGIEHVSNAIVVAAFRTSRMARPLTGTGYVVPRVENRPVMAVTWSSLKWRDRAPADHLLVRAFIGRAGRQHDLDGDDAHLTGLALAELREVMGIRGEPEFASVFRWEGGMPQYNLGHLDRVASIEAGVGAVPGIEIAGNMLRGVGIPDCIASGETAANNVLGWLARGHPVTQRESLAAPAR
ncbi:MAG: Protoporphyrinogen IX oxidase, aerobic, HemY [uncultured Thermomicrobiales bacterium]|uniref:Coproporphyrinogen III oxidase n=1 Tax=uncultured Thermomicrobiales bacterium TaxID=1645740 RepID=A0A6J4U680_9BACT|nr:MAG: Protoporphyrinogen IX oxidase, aerobic, HemY [uncultured Thermomicrobiales bacterium]